MVLMTWRALPLRYYEAAFHKATGVMLASLFPPAQPSRRPRLSVKRRTSFCASGPPHTPVGCDACLATQKRRQKEARDQLVPQQVSCFAA